VLSHDRMFRRRGRGGLRSAVLEVFDPATRAAGGWTRADLEPLDHVDGSGRPEVGYEVRILIHQRAVVRPSLACDGGHGSAGFGKVLEKLATLRGDVAEMAKMQAELEVLGDAVGVTAVASLRQAERQQIAEIEANLSEVSAAFCQ
jgi:hypothetical protein